MKIGEQLRLARTLKRLTQSEVARKAKTSQTTISYMERGLDAPAPLVRRVARVLGVPLQGDEQGRES
jgi:transcriptional regulator with XRE-family HTH domain